MDELLFTQKNQLLTRLEMAKFSLHLGKHPWQTVFNLAYKNSSITSISIIISLYNYSEYICECLDSVARTQVNEIPNGIEVIVVDDCSTDNSARIVEEYIKTSEIPILLIKKIFNTGLADARNVGLSMARSEYVFILDADNLIYPNCLATLYQEINSSNYASVYGIIKQFDNQTKEYIACLSDREWNVDELIRGPYIDAMALFNKKIIQELGGYSTELMAVGWSGWEDYDLWLKIAQAGYACKFVPQTLSAYRVHRRSMVNTTVRYIEHLSRYFIKKFSKLICHCQESDIVFGFTLRDIEADTFMPDKTYQLLQIAEQRIQEQQEKIHLANSQLQHTQAKLGQVESQLQQTQGEIEQVNLKLHHSQLDLQHTQIKLHHTQTELQQLEQKFETSNQKFQAQLVSAENTILELQNKIQLLDNYQHSAIRRGWHKLKAIIYRNKS